MPLRYQVFLINQSLTCMDLKNFRNELPASLHFEYLLEKYRVVKPDWRLIKTDNGKVIKAFDLLRGMYL